MTTHDTSRPSAGADPAPSGGEPAVDRVGMPVNLPDRLPPLPGWLAPDANWAWLAQRGTETAEDAEAAHTIVRAFYLLERSLDYRERQINELLDALEAKDDHG